MPQFLSFLFLFSIILACVGLLHMVPNRVIYWGCVVLSAMYAGAAIALHSGPAVVMSIYFAANAYLRVALSKQP